MRSPNALVIPAPVLRMMARHRIAVRVHTNRKNIQAKRRGSYSVLEAASPSLLIGHTDRILLRMVSFHVNPSGLALCRAKDGRRTVFATVAGQVIDRLPVEGDDFDAPIEDVTPTKVTFNPLTDDTFQANGSTILRARFAVITHNDGVQVYDRIP